MYRLRQQIGSGGFADIFQGTNVETGEPVAFKLEPIKSRHPQLFYEAVAYKMLNEGGSSVGIPNIWWYGELSGNHAMVLELLGPSLEDHLNFCDRKFSLKTTLMLADQMISRVEYVHGKHFLHRDITPDNFLMGTGEKDHDVYIIDFGLAKQYRDPETGEHIPLKVWKRFSGTARYCSIDMHRGTEQSRRDDLESIGYILIYFLRGSLPWQGLQTKTKEEKHNRIREKKMSTPAEVLCESFPWEFASYVNYTRNLGFEETPDYAYLKKLFHDLFEREGYELDYVFDWTLKRMHQDRNHPAQPNMPPLAPPGQPPELP